MDQQPNHLWDEHRWEAHLNSLERKANKRKSFVNNSWGDKEPVWLRFLKEYDDVEEALESYLDDELTYEEAYFPDDTDELDEDDDVDEDIFLFYEEILNEDITDLSEEIENYILDPAEQIDLEDLNDEEEDEDDMEAGEEWKASLFQEFDLEAYAESEDPFDSYYVYDEAREISLYFLKRTVEFPEALVSESYTRFMNESLQITTRFAAALAFDHQDINFLGAIITYCKKALGHANTALELIKQIKHEKVIHEREYNPLQIRLFELRNDIGLLIQEMREFLAFNQR